MNYREKVMAYADILHASTTEGYDMLKLLDERIQECFNDVERREYWVEVRGRLSRNSFHGDAEEAKKLERDMRHILEQYIDPDKLHRSNNIKRWHHIVKEMHSVFDLIALHHDEEYIREYPSEEQMLNESKHSLAFYNELLADPRMENLFRGIPLVNAVFESLVYTRNLDRRFAQFLEKNYVPVLRAHRKLAFEFIDLVNKEDDFLEEDYNDNNDMITLSAVFTREYKAELINIEVPAIPEVQRDDIYLEEIGATIIRYAKEPVGEGPLYYRVQREYGLTPISCVYKQYELARMLGYEYSQFIPIIGPTHLRKCELDIYTYLKIFSEEQILESCIAKSQPIIDEYIKTPYIEARDAYKRFVIELEETLEQLLIAGFITAKGKKETMMRAQGRGERYGLFTRY